MQKRITSPKVFSQTEIYKTAKRGKEKEVVQYTVDKREGQIENIAPEVKRAQKKARRKKEFYTKRKNSPRGRKGCYIGPCPRRAGRRTSEGGFQ